MAKKQTMMPLPTGGGTGRRLLGLVVIGVLVALVIRDPAGSATAARQLLGWGGTALDSLATFAGALGS